MAKASLSIQTTTDRDVPNRIIDGLFGGSQEAESRIWHSTITARLAGGRL